MNALLNRYHARQYTSISFDLSSDCNLYVSNIFQLTAEVLSTVSARGGPGSCTLVATIAESCFCSSVLCGALTTVLCPCK